jgi:hypothetical protein
MVLKEEYDHLLGERPGTERLDVEKTGMKKKTFFISSTHR